MRDETKIVHAGRDPQRFDGVVNPPVLYASTVLSRNLPEWEEKRRRRAQDLPGTFYGLTGTATTRALEDALAELEGGYRAIVYPSGLAACVVPILAYVKAGDHVLLTDSVYGPTRRFSDGMLARLGVEVSYYDPLVGAGIGLLGVIPGRFGAVTRLVSVSGLLVPASFSSAEARPSGYRVKNAPEASARNSRRRDRAK